MIDSADDDPLIGKVLGRSSDRAEADGYRLCQRLGTGGFGAVYRALPESGGKAVAVKVLRADRAALSTSAKERFRREAQAMLRMNHCRIAKVLQHGTSELGLEFLVMELLEGHDLGQHLVEQGRMSPADAIDLFEKITEAVAYAHEQGLAHRDLKPANVFLRDGALDPVILDFGLAKMLEGVEESLTATGIVLGTPQYMAPEQSTGGVIDQRADIYALGVMLYEVLSGHTPFRGNTPAQILVNAMTVPPPPLQTDLGIPARLDALVFKALAKAPDDRFQTIREFRTALTRALDPISSPAVSLPETREAQASVAPRGDKAPILRAAFGALLGVIAAAAGYAAWSHTRGAERTAPAVPPRDVMAHETQPETRSEREANEQTLERTELEGANEVAAEASEVVAPPATEPDSEPRNRSRRRPAAPTSDPTVLREASSESATRPATDESPPVRATSTDSGHSESEGEANYAQTAALTRQQLAEVRSVLGVLESTRRGVRRLQSHGRPDFCDRIGTGMPPRSDQIDLLDSIQWLRRVQRRACEPYHMTPPNSEELARLSTSLDQRLDLTEGRVRALLAELNRRLVAIEAMMTNP